MTTEDPLNGGDVVMDDTDQEVVESPSLIIPIKSSPGSDNFVEIFPEEITETASSTLLQVLKDEDADLSVWADAALLYVQYKQHARDASTILQAGCERTGGTDEERVRLFASAGIAHLTHAQLTAGKKGSAANDDLSSMADNHFTNSSKIDNLYPMTWMGRGMLNLSAGRLDQARFFFETTLKEYDRVLPALLGLAAVLYLENNFVEAQRTYAEAIRKYPHKSGAATRVGFGLCCYKLGQVDRAKAAFARALDIDPENVEAMVGSAVLDMASLDESDSEFNVTMEKAIKMMSMANLLDHSNAMVQNHLANHYFWKWTPIPGSAKVEQGSKLVVGTQPIPLDPGERIRIGTEFETYVAEDVEEDEEGKSIRMKDEWKEPTTSGLKVWKKDYDRVEALAKGAYNSTSVQDIQAESLYFLARVHHVRGDLQHANQFYERACKLSPSLSPARFGLAQTQIAEEKFAQAAINLQRVLASSNTATDALASLGLLEVKSGKRINEGLGHLRKAIDLDPLNPELVLLEALALQQHESNYPKALERYKGAVKLMERKGTKIPLEIYTNIGVLCHETKKFDECLEMYKKALDSLGGSSEDKIATLENTGLKGGQIRHPDNSMFHGYVDTNFEIECLEKEKEISKLKIADSQGKAEADVPIVVGDHVKVGESFESEVTAISNEGDSLAIELKKPFTNIPPTEEEKAEEKEDSEMNKDTKLPVYVKRENNRMKRSSTISIAFNLARLHEAAGRTLPAVELHKAILKRNPAYVNSYLRLACIAIDCGALEECAGWLKIAAKTAPGNPEVLTLIGNLHLSLCDWAPAQQVFDGLLAKKVPNVEAYAMLSLGNIYFANLDTPMKYEKYLKYSADYYKRILTKDTANAYAANGLGTVLAENAELFKAKEVFNRVREVSGDAIADAHINLGHIYLAQKKHPEALQMYQSYLKRTEDGTAPISSKSRTDDKVNVLLYIAFAYFDWARQAELFNNHKAAPADERYKKAMHHLELAISENTSKTVLLTYNLCMTKLQAANCVLQKLTRNIRRTAKEVEEALNGLEQSLKTVEEILAKKKDQSLKVPIATSTLDDFLNHCRSNIDSAKSHLEEERRREKEVNELRELQRLASESSRKQQELEEQLKKETEAKKQEERDSKAREKMSKIQDLQAGWEMEKAATEQKKTKKAKTAEAPPAEDVLFPEEEEPVNTKNLFEDSDDSDNEAEKPKSDEAPASKPDGTTQEDLFGADSSDDEDVPAKPNVASEGKKNTTQEELFGDSSDESDEELVPSSAKRSAEEDSDEQPQKKQKVAED
mmetsp:Transcript_40299/g.97305  ORF Transcript_40299/g.97305 Transcript_40299/m.97305 type:complete len:1294 (+) Transcript_40299:108-3989(+)